MQFHSRIAWRFVNLSVDIVKIFPVCLTVWLLNECWSSDLLCVEFSLILFLNPLNENLFLILLPKQFQFHTVQVTVVLYGAANRHQQITLRWGFSSFFRASEKKLKSKFPGNFPGKFRASENFEFLISFWDFSIRDRKKFPTEDHEGVRFGSGGNPNNDERWR